MGPLWRYVGLEISAGANDLESGRPAPWEMKALSVQEGQSSPAP